MTILRLLKNSDVSVLTNFIFILFCIIEKKVTRACREWCDHNIREIVLKAIQLVRAVRPHISPWNIRLYEEIDQIDRYGRLLVMEHSNKEY